MMSTQPMPRAKTALARWHGRQEQSLVGPKHIPLTSLDQNPNMESFYSIWSFFRPSGQVSIVKHEVNLYYISSLHSCRNPVNSELNSILTNNKSFCVEFQK